MKRSGPIKRGAPPKRKAWLRSTGFVRRTRSRHDTGLRAARLEVRQRSGGRCEANTPRCKGTGHHAHHVILRSRGGPDTADNLLWVCAPCHEWIHAHPEEATVLGLMRSGWRQ